MPDEPTGAPAEGTPTPSTETAAPEPWAPVADRVGELASTVGDLQSSFQTFLAAQPQPEPQQAPDPFAALYADPAQQQQPDPFDPFAQQPEPQPQFTQEALQAAFQQAVAQANQPLMAQLQGMQLERDTQQLYTEIPQLADRPENQETRKQTAELVYRSLNGYPPEIANRLGADPRYIATVFKAAEAEKLAVGQAPASEHVPALEAAGGALPGGDGAPVNPVHQAYGNQPQGLSKAFS